MAGRKMPCFKPMKKLRDEKSRTMAILMRLPKRDLMEWIHMRFMSWEDHL